MSSFMYEHGKLSNMQDSSYINSNGDLVFTSHYHRSRGTCCESNCLHCPFGTTLKNYGLKLKKISENEVQIFLKGVQCGRVIVDDGKLIDISIDKHFCEQGITKDLVSTFF